jgi:hypothetical protein
VNKTEELRSRADACYQNARGATGSADKMRWLAMAQFWLELAMQSELEHLARRENDGEAPP